MVLSPAYQCLLIDCFAFYAFINNIDVEEHYITFFYYIIFSPQYVVLLDEKRMNKYYMFWMNGMTNVRLRHVCEDGKKQATEAKPLVDA